MEATPEETPIPLTGETSTIPMEIDPVPPTGTVPALPLEDFPVPSLEAQPVQRYRRRRWDWYPQTISL